MYAVIGGKRSFYTLTAVPVRRRPHPDDAIIISKVGAFFFILKIRFFQATLFYHEIARKVNTVIVGTWKMYKNNDMMIMATVDVSTVRVATNRRDNMMEERRLWKRISDNA